MTLTAMEMAASATSAAAAHCSASLEAALQIDETWLISEATLEALIVVVIVGQYFKQTPDYLCTCIYTLRYNYSLLLRSTYHLGTIYGLWYSSTIVNTKAIRYAHFKDRRSKESVYLHTYTCKFCLYVYWIAFFQILISCRKCAPDEN